MRKKQQKELERQYNVNSMQEPEYSILRKKTFSRGVFLLPEMSGVTWAKVPDTFVPKQKTIVLFSCLTDIPCRLLPNKSIVLLLI